MASTQKGNGEAPANVPARQPQRPIDTLRDLLEKSKGQIARALPKHLTADRMIRVAITAVQRTPALLECSPLSIVGCVMQAAELGLEMSGPLGQAYMVPYRNKQTGQREAQFQPGYKGLVKLAYNSGLVSLFTAHVVYSGDEFAVRYGSDPDVSHTPTLTNRGQPVAAYAVLRMKDGSCDVKVMTVDEINGHRRKYSKQRGEDSAWETEWDEMACKTVLRKLSKRAPLSAEVVYAVQSEEEAEVPEAPLRRPLPDWPTRMPEMVPPGPAEGEVIEPGDAQE